MLKQKNTPKTAAIIVCAGNCVRMNGLDKITVPLCGIPAAARSMLAYQAAECIDDIIVVTRPDLIAQMTEYREKYSITKLKRVVAGASFRGKSVLNGITACDADVKYIAIADGARALTSINDINLTCSTAYKTGAAALGAKVVDTLKKTDKDGKIIGSVDRQSLIQIQTPQVFELQEYLTATAHFYKEARYQPTDDCTIFEYSNKPISFVEGEGNNIKITTRNDVVLCEFIISRKERIELK